MVGSERQHLANQNINITTGKEANNLTAIIPSRSFFPKWHQACPLASCEQLKMSDPVWKINNTEETSSATVWEASKAFLKGILLAAASITWVQSKCWQQQQNLIFLQHIPDNGSGPKEKKKDRKLRKKLCHPLLAHLLFSGFARDDTVSTTCAFIWWKLL